MGGGGGGGEKHHPNSNLSVLSREMRDLISKIHRVDPDILED